MPDVIVTGSPGSVTVQTTPPGSVEVVTGSGPSSGGGGSSVQNTFISQIEPTPAAGTGAFIWYQTDVDGHVIDIRKGAA